MVLDGEILKELDLKVLWVILQLVGLAMSMVLFISRLAQWFARLHKNFCRND